MKSELLIINYHYFREQTYKSGIYPVSKKQFIEDIDLLSKKYTFADVDTALLGNKKSVLLTFDDGLEEQMEAFDIMYKKGINGIFFVSSLPYLENKALDVHRLHYIRSQLSDKFLIKKLNSLISINNSIINRSKIQYKYDNQEAAVFKYIFNFLIDENSKKSFLDLIFSELSISETDFINSIYMSEDSLTKLISSGSIGSHCHSHRPLSNLSSDEKKADIKLSLNYLNSLGGEIKSISYPYGSELSIDNDVFEICSENKLNMGITMIRGVNYLNKKYNKYMLKRISNNDIKNYI